MKLLDLNSLLPGSREGRDLRKKYFTISIEVTGRCNSYCSYCHFYAIRDREQVGFDLTNKTLISYFNFIKSWKEKIVGHTTYRFSGGDPIVLKDELFKIVDLGYSITGIKPFVLTHGRGMNQNWIDKAKKSNIAFISLSVENPKSPDKGALNPLKSIELLEKFNSSELPISLGVCLISNEHFKDLLEICDWFYERIGYIPPIAEINYSPYKRPNEVEWKQLERSLIQVFEKYYGKVYLNLFHSVSPELGYSDNDPYIFNLDIHNKYNITNDNIDEKIIQVINALEKSNYPKLNCANKKCDWWEYCDNTKWYWQGDKINSKNIKISDYCRFKRILNDTFFTINIDNNHQCNVSSYFE